MSVSAIFGARLAVSPAPAAVFSSSERARVGTGCVKLPVIECSSRPQKKATAHHKKTRPRKTQAWDIRRGPAVYAPLPPLPADYTLVIDNAVDAQESAPALEAVEA